MSASGRSDAEPGSADATDRGLIIEAELENPRPADAIFCSETLGAYGTDAMIPQGPDFNAGVGRLQQRYLGINAMDGRQVSTACLGIKPQCPQQPAK
jgi:hypothetical protein